MTSLLVALALAATGPAVIEDDYARALAEAKKTKKLLFVDAWAPWCHTCVFMREHVINQPAFAAFGKDVVFAAIDTEKTSNAPFLEKFTVNVWPTLFFIDPASEALVFKWVGSADAAQMKGLLEAARRKDGVVREADALFASGRSQEAAEKYVAGLKGEQGDAAVRATLSMLNALSAAKQHEPCARTANEQAPSIRGVSDRINALTWGLSCALELPKDAKDRDGTLTSLVKQATAALSLDGALADDVSGLYELLVEERKAAQDDAGVVALGKAWLTFLEAAAAKAKTPAARAVFDPHRLLAAMASKQLDRVIPALEQSEKELPSDFNPPARLALAHKEQGQLDLAAADIARALTKNTGGPRRVRLFDVQASIFAAKGDVTGQRKALADAIAYGRTLPAPQQPTKKLAALEEQLAKLAPPPPPAPGKK
ncbi:MAG: thioredoxin family protein [Myxococcaceae bacterium]|nr:thioredoxin family protein [Myxococcaceae bacterium]